MDLGIFALAPDCNWIGHLLPNFLAHRSACIRGILLVQLSMELVLESDDEVVHEPHVELVNESVGGNQPVSMNRIFDLLDLESIAGTGLVNSDVHHIELLEILWLWIISRQHFQQALVFSLGLWAEID